MTRRVLVSVPLCATLGLLGACGEDLNAGGSGDVTEPGSNSSNSGWPETITYGVLPTTEDDSIAESYEPFKNYMSACLDHPFETFTGANYTAMIEAMRGGNVDVGKFGPFSYTLAAGRANAEAFVQLREKADEGFYTARFVALESSGLKSLEDLKGQSVAFADPTSTSGYMFPRAMLLKELGLENDELDGWLGEVLFSGSHDASLISVLNGDVAAAPISSNSWTEGGTMETMKDHPNFDELFILAETEDIPRSVEAFRSDLPESLKTALRDCFTAAIDEPDLTDFLIEISAPAGYFPIDDSAYEVVRETVALLELSPEELLEQ